MILRGFNPQVYWFSIFTLILIIQNFKKTFQALLKLEGVISFWEFLR